MESAREDQQAQDGPPTHRVSELKLHQAEEKDQAQAEREVGNEYERHVGLDPEGPPQRASEQGEQRVESAEVGCFIPMRGDAGVVDCVPALPHADQRARQPAVQRDKPKVVGALRRVWDQVQQPQQASPQRQQQALDQEGTDAPAPVLREIGNSGTHPPPASRSDGWPFGGVCCAHADGEHTPGLCGCRGEARPLK